jgi:ElaB/YqjD/DUF883 family membrane-anchored ribosome-binding protein
MNGYLLNYVYIQDNADLTARNLVNRPPELHILVVASPDHLHQQGEFPMVDTNRMAEDAQAKFRDVADRVSDKAEEFVDQAGDTVRKATDKVNRSAKDGLKAAKHFVGAAQQYVEDSGLAEVDVAEIVKRDPWIALGVAFAVGYVAAQIVRRLSN